MLVLRRDFDWPNAFEVRFTLVACAVKIIYVSLRLNMASVDSTDAILNRSETYSVDIKNWRIS